MDKYKYLDLTGFLHFYLCSHRHDHVRDFKYVNITVDFARQPQRIVNRIFKKLKQKEHYLEYHEDEFYRDGIRIQGLRKPWITIRDIKEAFNSVGVDIHRIEMVYFHPWHHPDPFSEDAPIKIVTWKKE